MIHGMKSMLSIKSEDTFLIKCAKIYGKLMMFCLFFFVIVGLMALDVFRKTSKIEY